jgi:hypothetical protein
LSVKDGVEAATDGGEPEIFPLQEGLIPPWSPEPEEQPDVVVRGLVRSSADSWTVTLFLVNEQREPEHHRDEAWVFQPELRVESPDGAPIFQHRSTGGRAIPSDEEQAMAMLYRHHVGFAIGHGVSTHADIVPGDPTRAIRLSTRAVPSYDVPRTEAPTSAEVPGLADLVLDMKELAETPAAELPNKLTPLATAYAAWIAEQTVRIDGPAAGLGDYRHVAEQAIAECHHARDRIQAGIDLLAQHAQAAQALRQWIEDPARRKHDRSFHEAHTQWRKTRHMEYPELGYPGLRYVLLHSFAHALMHQLTLECGYTSASIRERIYSLYPEQEGDPTAGILLYTAAPDSEGTLGGLVGLGVPDQLGQHLDGALERMQTCTSDPLCAEHITLQDRSLHEAACHACLFLPETSCERGNKYLDRSVLVPTVNRADLAFFETTG